MIFKKTSNTLRQDRNNNSKWTSYILYVYEYTHICWLYTTRKLSMKHVPQKKWIIDIAQFIGCILRSHPYSTTHGSKKTTILYPFHGHWLFIYTHVLNNYPNLLGQTPMWISWIGRFQVWCLIPMCFMVSSSFILYVLSLIHIFPPFLPCISGQALHLCGLWGSTGLWSCGPGPKGGCDLAAGETVR